MTQEYKKVAKKQIAIITVMLMIAMAMLGVGVGMLFDNVQQVDATGNHHLTQGGGNPCSGGHNWSGWQVVTHPTCTTTGTDRRTCNRSSCSASETRTTSSSHLWGAWTVTSNPTCTTAGNESRTCHRRGCVENSSIPALGHSMGSWSTTVQPTCTAAGTQRRTCTRCGGNAQTQSAPAALGHDGGTWTRVTNPTCTANGSDRNNCNRCGAQTSTRTVAALGHIRGNWITQISPTCTSGGHDTLRCTRASNGCGLSILEQRWPAALGHEMSSWFREVNPTCTATGNDRRNCGRCTHFERSTVAALGHQWGGWWRQLEPTCTANGNDRNNCVRGCVDNRTVAALGHNRAGCRCSYSFPTSGSIVGTRPGFSNVTAGTWTVSAVSDRWNRPSPGAGRVYHYQGITISMTISDQGFTYLTNQEITNRTSRTGGGTLSAVSGAGTARTFTITNVQSNITAITVASLPIQTFSITYPRGNPPHTQAGTINQTDFASAIKVWGLPFRLNTNKYTLQADNWEHVGWTTSTVTANRILNHRNFANTGTTSPTLFVPNGTTSWGAGAAVIDVNMQTINWSSAQMNIPDMQNAAHVLHPIWAPARTELRFVLGTAPPSSGNITPTSLPTGIRLTSQQFTFPSATNVYTVNTGAVWQQIGWNLGGSAKYLAPLSNLPAIDFAPNSLFPTTHTEAFTNWGATREIHPTWRRVITNGKVNIISVGGPCVHPCRDPQGCFMHVGLANIGVSAKMPFEVTGSTINHKGTSNQITLPSFNEMTALGEENGLTFQGWYIRTTWAPATQRIDDTATPNARVVIPWQDGIFAHMWEPYVWVKAKWG